MYVQGWISSAETDTDDRGKGVDGGHQISNTTFA
jgi:hypothetical protein